MKEWKVTTMPSVARKNFVPKKEFLEIFKELIIVLKPYEKFLDVRNRSETNYELWTNHAYRTKSFRPKQMKGVLFVGVSVLKSHVGVYFYPLHMADGLKTKLPAPLQLALVGKSTFHITSTSAELFANLKQMLNLGTGLYEEKGWIGKLK